MIGKGPNMKKKTKTTTKKTTKASASKPKKTTRSRTHMANPLSAAPQFKYNDFSEEKLFAGLEDAQSLSQITKALQGVEPWLFSLIQDMPKGVFKDAKEDAQFTADLNNVLHGLKNLSSLVHKNFLDK